MQSDPKELDSSDGDIVSQEEEDLSVHRPSDEEYEAGKLLEE